MFKLILVGLKEQQIAKMKLLKIKVGYFLIITLYYVFKNYSTLWQKASLLIGQIFIKVTFR